MSEQLTMFETEDLPLFSGTAPRGRVDPFAPKVVHKQEHLPAKCRHCANTGVLGEHAFCWCEIGQETRRKRKAKGPKAIRYYDEEGNDL